MKPYKVILLAVGSALSMGAAAQWQWLDRDGRQVYSDRPPTSDIPEKNILKRPGRPAAAATAPLPDASAAGAALSAKVAASAARGGKDPDLQDKKKQAEAAEAAKKKAEDDRVAKANRETCARARQNKTTLDSGMRIARLNAKGEREVLDDPARAAELQRIQGIIDSACRAQ
ncbi:MAG: DUF4124 domain-containing protein [Burkholderiaceae bacterium]|nr:DUF4124 domain-containing protein [Burkholderiaceae bacterium]MDO9089771.1 DUF4124 domain-containing protein [Burkholderiaceae bacterium]MDP1969210.1 DUF4124 domain-containing protein [Burkholderiaceae bacterium]